MPRRRKLRKRRRNKQFRFRTGQIGAAGGRPITPKSRNFKVVCAASLGNEGVGKAGGHAVFDLTVFDAPCDPVNKTLVLLGSSFNHPVGHADLISDGYTRVFLKNKMYRFDIRFRGSDSAAKDFVFAYKFGTSTGSSLAHYDSGLRTIDNWTDMRQSRGWIWKRFSSTSSGGSSYPSAARVDVRIPNIKQLVFGLTKPSTNDRTWETCSVLLDDTSQNLSVHRAFLHIVVMSIDGVALADNDIQIDVTCFMEGMAYRFAADGTEMIEEAGQIGTDIMV